MTALRLSFDGTDRRLAIFTVLLIAVSFAYVSANYSSAFPQASLKLTLSEREITAKAAQFLNTRGLPVDRFRNITLFDPDDEARLYLERELGLDGANRLMEHDVPVWRWRARWFRPPDKEEIRVWLRPDGRLTGYEHRILETDEGYKLDRDSARFLAQQFLESQSSKKHKLIAEQTEVRPKRVDHVFTWEEEGFKAKDATIRRTVEVYGNKVGRYFEFLYVPEQWQRDFTKLRSANELYASIAQALYVLLAIGALVLVFQGLRGRTIPWMTVVRISGFVAVVNLISEWNSLKEAIDRMPTSSSFSEMLLFSWLGGLGNAAGIFGYVIAPAAAGAVLFSKYLPSVMPLKFAFTTQGIATRSFFRSSLVGLSMAAGHMIFLTAFYVIGAKFGVWSPADVDYSDVLATPLPFIYPIGIGLMASSAEEFWFRLLAIPLLGKLLKSRWLAILIPAFVWGFLHANYPQQPGYIRGVEVGAIGVVAGIVMMRFGIVATLFWHFTIDAFLIGLPLLRATNHYFQFNGLLVLLVILAPLALSLRAYIANQGFLPEPQPEPPADVEPTAHTIEPEPAAEVVQPRMPARLLYVVAGVLALLAYVLRPVQFGDSIRISVIRQQAEAAAIAELEKKGVKTQDWQMVSDFAANLRTQDAEYLRQRVGASKANEILLQSVSTAIWRVRFFQPLNAEEWLFYVRQDGKVYRFDHELDEKAAGAQPTSEEARLIAEEYLVTSQGKSLDDLVLVDTQEDKKEKRTDHSFVWEDKSFHVGEAKLRIGLQMVGNETCEYRPFLKLPEEWLRDYTKMRIAEFALSALAGAAGIWLLIALIRRLGAPDHIFHWRIYSLLAVVAILISLVDLANAYPVWLRSYQTATPLRSFYGQFFTSRAASTLFSGVTAFVMALSLDAFLQALTPRHVMPRPSLLKAAAIGILFAASGPIAEWARQHTPGARGDLPLWSMPQLDMVVPALATFSSSWNLALMAVCAGGIVVCGALRLLTPRSLLRMAGLTILSIAIGDTMSLIQLPVNIFLAACGLGLILLIVLTCATDVLSVALGLFWASIASDSWMLLEQPSRFLMWNGLAALAMAVAVTIIVLATTCKFPRL